MKRHSSSGAGAVRIIGGEWRGTRLPVADVGGLRPTSDRVRETLFNWLQPKLAGARVLDLFAGSGALGLEAVSRGASEAWLVERDPVLAEALRGTAERLKAGARVQVARADALAWLQAPLHGRFDVVFLDPPFDAGLWAQALERLPPWLADDAWLYLERPALEGPAVGGPGHAQPDPGGGWQQHRAGRTREVRYALYRRAHGAAATLQADLHADGATTSA